MFNRIFFGFIILGSLNSYGQGSGNVGVAPHGSAVIVSRVDVSAKWYEQILGLKQVNRMVDDAGTYKVIILESPQMILELLELSGSVAPSEVLSTKPEGAKLQGHFKIAFKVKDMDAFLKHLSDLKIAVPKVWTDQKTGKRNFLIEDPDKNLLQFFD